MMKQYSKKTMINPSATTILILFLSLLGVEPAAACPTIVHPHKLAEFLRRLEERKAAAQLSSTLTPSNCTEHGRVFCPAQYGADPTGAADSSDAIFTAVNEACKVNSSSELLPGIKNLGGVVIDLQGGTYTLSKPIVFPSAVGNLLFISGTLRASETFPGNSHLIRLARSSRSPLTPSRLYYDGITFRDVLFDSGYRGGGLFVAGAIRIRVTGCYFLRFTTSAVLVTAPGHEFYISDTFLGQHPTAGGSPEESSFTGTAIDLGTNDNAITNVVVFSAETGILVRGQANILAGVHCYNKASSFGGRGIYVKSASGSSLLTRITSCYMDYNDVVIEDPNQVLVTDCFFFGGARVVLSAVKGQVNGLTVVSNMFTLGPSRLSGPIVSLNGTFNSVQQVVIDGNSVDRMAPKSTVARRTVIGNEARKKWVADFSKDLVFPNRICHFQHSFRRFRGGGVEFPLFAVTDILDNVVVVESDRMISGSVSVEVHQ